jgi:adenine/guanine phosphoribosyltransferase-like PRPP-binding protein
MYIETNPYPYGDYDHSDYMRYTIRTEMLGKAVAASAKFLKTKDFEAIAFMGNSGALLAAPLALALRKPMILVRKPLKKETSHSYHLCEGFRVAKSYIIVDDFVQTGTTVNYIREQVKEWLPDAKLVGVLECSRLLDDMKPYWHTAFPWGRRG